MRKSKKNAEVRDAVMLYVTQVIKVKYQELAFITSVIYSTTFLIALLRIRIEMEKENENLYSLSALEGVDPQPNEDEETLGDKLVEWVNENLEDYRKPID